MHKSPPLLRDEPPAKDHVKESLKQKGSKLVLPSKLVSTTSDKENESVQQALNEINAKELSDVEAPGWTDERDRFKQLGQKRQLRVEESEASKRKVCRTAMIPVKSPRPH